jgi:hypothetical protein
MFPVVHIDKELAFRHRVSENMLKIRLQQAGRNRGRELDGASGHDS